MKRFLTSVSVWADLPTLRVKVTQYMSPTPTTSSGVMRKQMLWLTGSRSVPHGRDPGPPPAAATQDTGTVSLPKIIFRGQTSLQCLRCRLGCLRPTSGLLGYSASCAANSGTLLMGILESSKRMPEQVGPCHLFGKLGMHFQVLALLLQAFGE